MEDKILYSNQGGLEEKMFTNMVLKKYETFMQQLKTAICHKCAIHQ